MFTAFTPWPTGFKSCHSPMSTSAKARAGEAKAFADISACTLRAELRGDTGLLTSKANDHLLFHYPGIPKVGGAAYLEVTEPTLTASQEPSQCEEALHFLGSGKQNTSHGVF